MKKPKKIKGTIIDSGSRKTNYGSCLFLKLENVKEEVLWQSQSEIPIKFSIGDFIKGYYNDSKKIDNKKVMSEIENHIL